MSLQLVHDDYRAFLNKYYATKPRVQRLGQAFVNYFFKNGMVHPELFYEEDDEVAKKIIMTTYVRMYGGF